MMILTEKLRNVTLLLTQSLALSAQAICRSWGRLNTLLTELNNAVNLACIIENVPSHRKKPLRQPAMPFALPNL
ncbi:hypothetical protein [Pseudomonas sp. NPDC087614]|uniref:hypothetical protein n=1 Tax=Pseudomonas sp. NPDC087614 TaxID=3364442 RepID=UPI0037FFC108